MRTMVFRIATVLLLVAPHAHADKEWVVMGAALTRTDNGIQSDLFFPIDMSVSLAGKRIGIFSSQQGELPGAFKGTVINCGISLVGMTDVTKVEWKFSHQTTDVWQTCTTSNNLRWKFDFDTSVYESCSGVFDFRVTHKDNKKSFTFLFLKYSSRQAGRLQIGTPLRIYDNPYLPNGLIPWNCLPGFDPVDGGDAKYLGRDVQKIQQEYEQRLAAKQSEVDALKNEKKTSISLSELAEATKRCQKTEEERDALRSQLDEIKKQHEIVQSAFTKGGVVLIKGYGTCQVQIGTTPPRMTVVNGLATLWGIELPTTVTVTTATGNAQTTQLLPENEKNCAKFEIGGGN